MEQRVRFCKTPNAERMAYAVTGQGPPLVVVSGWVSHLQLHWDSEAPRRVWEALSRNHTLIRYDKPGTGLSDRDVKALGLEARVQDLEALVDHLDLDTFDLFGWSEGGPTAIVYAAGNPQRVRRLVLYGTFAKWGHPKQVVDPLIAIVRTQWGLGAAALSAAFVPSGDPEQIAYFTNMQRVSAHPSTAAEMLKENTTIDVQEEARLVACPAVVMNRDGDILVSMSDARLLASLIPDASLVALHDNDHLFWWGDSQAIVDAIEDFLGVAADKHTAMSEPSSFRTVLFTDVVGHTAMMRRLGDEKGRAVLREHESVTRSVLKDHGGAEIKTMGDGFMASFPSVTRAVECALALQQAFADRNSGPTGVRFQPDAGGAAELLAPEPLHIRVGLNAGEPIEEDGDLFGETVILAARIAAMAKGGEVLASLAVRELCAGKGFLFADMGEHAMRGFEDPVRVFEIKRPG